MTYPCLENPRDGRAWWDALYGVSQSRTRLKRLSSSSSSSSKMLIEVYFKRNVNLKKIQIHRTTSGYQLGG